MSSLKSVDCHRITDGLQKGIAKLTSGWMPTQAYEKRDYAALVYGRLDLSIA